MAEAKQTVPATEFWDWATHFDMEANDFHRNDWFYATMCQLLYEIPSRVWGKSAGSKLEQFFIKFSSAKPADKTKKEKKEAVRSQEELLAAAKEFRDAAFAAFASVKGKREALKKNKADLEALKAEQTARAERLAGEKQTGGRRRPAPIKKP